MPVESVKPHGHSCGSATVNSAFALVDLVIKYSLIPFSRLFLRLGGTLTRGKRSAFSPGFGVADRLSCVLLLGDIWVMASALPTVPLGELMLSYQHFALGLPLLFAPPSRRSARQLNIQSTSILIFASLVSLYKYYIVDPQTRFVPLLRTDHGAKEGQHRLQRRQKNLRRDAPSRRRG